MTGKPVVHLIDDDRALRDSLRVLLNAHGIETVEYESAETFLAQTPADLSGCLLIDLNMPGMSGLQLLEQLAERGIRQPSIIFTGAGQIASAVQAMKLGAMDFLEKPCESSVLVDLVRRGLTRSQELESEEMKSANASKLLSALTPRERSVFLEMAKGHPNKVIAQQLGISPRTVEVHRANVMTKLSAAGVADVVRVAIAAGLSK